jgi:uncharacterized protein (DUF1330 family)
MTVYAIFVRERTHDEDELNKYRSVALDTFKGTQARMLVRNGELESLEGPAPEGVIVIEFPTMDEARSWYNDPAYQKIAKHRFNAAKYQGFLVKALETPIVGGVVPEQDR